MKSYTSGVVRLGRVPITVMGFHCERCEHEWIPRSENGEEPRVCPRCKSPYWNKPRKNVEGYEQFRDAIAKVLRTAPTGLSWTEIRTRERLPQKFPNNVWVKRMEADPEILLIREGHGNIRWRSKLAEEDYAQVHRASASNRSAAGSAAE
jgi:hypothetical protein